MSTYLDEFARELMASVRDRAICACDMNLRDDVRNLIAERWRTALGGEDVVKRLHDIIPDIVDETLFRLMVAIDDGSLRLSYRAEDGTVVDLEKESGGEGPGSYAAKDDWHREYSRQRVNDDFRGCDWSR